MPTWATYHGRLVLRLFPLLSHYPEFPFQGPTDTGFTGCARHISRATASKLPVDLVYWQYKCKCDSWVHAWSTPRSKGFGNNLLRELPLGNLSRELPLENLSRELPPGTSLPRNSLGSARIYERKASKVNHSGSEVNPGAFQLPDHLIPRFAVTQCKMLHFSTGNFC